MTVPSSTSRDQQSGDGVTVAFTVPFRILDQTHIQVLLTVGSVTTKQALTTNYTVSGVGGANTTVTFLSAPPNGSTITFLRSVPITQETDYVPNDPFPAESHERALDKAAMIDQQQEEVLDRALTLPPEVSGVSTQLPAPVALAPLVWSAAGDALENGDITLTGDLLLRGNLAESSGAALVSWLQLGTNATPRTLHDRMRDRLSALDFIGYNLSDSAAQALRTAIRERTTTSADKANIVLGVQAACAAASARAGVAVHLPAGTYYLDGIDVSGMHGLAVIGDGPEATKIITDSATADVFKTTTESRYQTFADFTVTSSVTRTAGAFFSLALWKRGLLSHVRMTRWFNALYIPTAEVCTLLECYITDPSGYGDAMVLGTASTAGQVSGFNLINCFVRGCDDTTASPPVARYGIASYDVDAIFGFNCDIGSFKDCDLLIAPNERSANHHFVQCYFDATKDFDCIRMQGAGSKRQMTFNGCWIASGGKLTSGSVEACGVRALNTGTYQDINFANTRFYSSNGSGVLLEMPGADFHFPGCTFYANGAGGGTNRHGFKWLPASAATIGPSLAGARFGGANAPKDIYVGANGNTKMTAQAVHLETGIDCLAALGRAAGFDPTTAVIASATRPAISPFHDFVRVTGTTNIAGLDVTYPGHLVTLKFDGVLTVIDASQNLALAGNFTTAAGSTLTLRCDGATWWEVARANT